MCVGQAVCIMSRITQNGNCPIKTPEAHARQIIDEKLDQAGWIVQDASGVNLYAGRGVAMREFTLKAGFGRADYVLYVAVRAVGVIEAKE